MHPVVLYYKDDNKEVQCTSLCFLSSDVEHDTSFVFELQRQTCEYVKKALPNVTLLEYFSDGRAGQYKNFKTLLNHSSDFGFVQCGASLLPVMGSHHAMDSGELSRDYFYEQAFRGP